MALVAAALLGLFAAQAGAAESGLTLSDGWLRVIVPERPAAGYFTLRNDGDKPMTLIGAESPACGNIMLHQSKTVNGVATMAMVKRVAVPAHGKLRFAPLGYHLMCMSPDSKLAPGKTAPVTLHFEGGATLTADFAVRGPTGR